jgi:hypothetical protein
MQGKTMRDETYQPSRRRLLQSGATAFAVTLLPPNIAVAAKAYEAVAVKGAAALRGTVSLAGAVPQPQHVLIGKDNHVCGDGHAVQSPVRVEDGRLMDAVVFFEAIDKGKPWPKAAAAEIFQEKCAFHPYVQLARRGADLRIVNKDPLLHNIHAYELIGRARRTMFNVAQPQAGQVDVQPLALRRGQVVEVACDAHNWMSAWIVALDHPYAAVVGGDGGFELGDVPPGAYRLIAWHPTLGSLAREVEVEAGGRATIDFTFSTDKT